ncbi:MAG: hypothetical protein ACR2KJ_16680 [Jatrophihabitans sp.]
MTIGQHRADSVRSSPAEELAHDIRREKRITWKGLLAVVVAAVIALVRHRWWV